MKRGVLFLLVFLVSLVAVFGEEGNAGIYPLLSFLHDVGGHLYWDPLGRKGLISTPSHLLSFSPESPVAYLDYRTPVKVTFTERNGAIFLTDETKDRLLSLLEEERGPRIAAIILDPGHGGKDPGTIGTHTLSDGKKLVIQEKEVVLSISLRLRDLLEKAYPDKRIFLTRESDRYLSLEERTEFANTVLSDYWEDAVLFISIHANASLNRNAKGFEVWYLPEDYRRTVVDPKDVEAEEVFPILNSMKEEELFVEGLLLARMVSDGLESTIGKVSPNRGLKAEKWYVVRNARMPAVLVEVGFVTEPEEARLLSTPAYLQDIARGLYNGVARFIEHYESLSF
ncbi:N-acetylmuramoyl-L-alanine amidase family protein [Spirochaeta thermophila]|uniref:N-acetylmuramoyl-L-alanine amidase n=1 Tax=Winmispira thermophila (strain ATCC 49972 / DSM 6192 / RI 19.B1) TaxID=665571 RepID=E0RSC4_WINT6|nr:N-acetylmuramoyl-L-alanine amidase [Spirochaeta thermophila]ADN01911.1 hypothetical protein STHERM_c09650 [Spirochaeta thermophila DSM 6192]